jgi:hypothetical protein
MNPDRTTRTWAVRFSTSRKNINESRSFRRTLPGSVHRQIFQKRRRNPDRRTFWLYPQVFCELRYLRAPTRNRRPDIEPAL